MVVPPSKRDIVRVVGFIVELVIEGGCFGWRALWGGIGTGAGVGFAEFPGDEVDVEALFELVATDVEGDADVVADGKAVEDRCLILDALEFDHLGILAVLDFDDEFTLGEAAGEGLEVHEVLEGAGEFEVVGHGLS